MSAISSALFPQKLKHRGKKENELIQRTSKSYHCRDVSGPVYLTEEARHKYGEFIKQVEGKICNFLLEYYYWIYRFLDKYVYVYRLVCFCVKSLGVPYGHFS